MNFPSSFRRGFFRKYSLQKRTFAPDSKFLGKFMYDISNFFFHLELFFYISLSASLLMNLACYNQLGCCLWFLIKFIFL